MQATAPAPAGARLCCGGARLQQRRRGAAARSARHGRAALAATAPRAALEAGSHTQMGTSRKQNEDRFVVQARAQRRAMRRDATPARAFTRARCRRVLRALSPLR
jgi:hypothetical protein